MKTKNIISTATVRKISAAFAAESKGIKSLIANTDAVIQLAVDSMLLACASNKKEFLKGNSRTNPHRAEVSALFSGLADAGHFSPKSATQYCSAFWVAFETGAPFSRSALNTPRNDKDASKGASKGASTKGASTKASRDGLRGQLKAALASARALKLDAFASDLLDLIVDEFPDFKESPDK